MLGTIEKDGAGYNSEGWCGYLPSVLMNLLQTRTLQSSVLRSRLCPIRICCFSGENISSAGFLLCPDTYCCCVLVLSSGSRQPRTDTYKFSASLSGRGSRMSTEKTCSGYPCLLTWYMLKTNGSIIQF